MMRKLRAPLLAATLTLWLAALLLPAGVRAQVSKSTLLANLATCFPANNSGNITPALVLSCLNSIVNSYQQYAAVNAQSGSSYTLAASDYGQFVQFSNAAAVALPSPQTAGFFPWNAMIDPTGSGAVVITPQNEASFTGTGSGANLTVTGVTGTIYPGTLLSQATGVPAGTFIVSQNSGTTGGAGVYVTSQATTVTAAALTSAPAILGAASLTVSAGQAAWIVSDGTNYQGLVFGSSYLAPGQYLGNCGNATGPAQPCNIPLSALPASTFGPAIIGNANNTSGYPSWLPLGQGLAFSACSPSWLACAENLNPYLQVDIVNGYYYYNGTSDSSLAAWYSAASASFVSADGGQYIGSDGLRHTMGAGTGIAYARIDYDPITLKPRRWMLEPGSNNVLTYSEALTNAAWTATGVTPADNAVQSPYGTQTGSTLTESGSSSSAHAVTQSYNSNAGEYVNCEIASAGSNGGHLLNLSVSAGGHYVSAVFDLNQPGGPTEIASDDGFVNNSMSWSVTPDGNFAVTGAFRYCIYDRIASLSSPYTVQDQIGMAGAANGNTFNSYGEATYVGSNKTINLYGASAQSSYAQVPTSYVKTTSASVATGGDILKVPPGDTAASVSLAMQFLMTHSGTAVGIPANLYYGSNQDTATAQGNNVVGGLEAVHAPDGNNVIDYSSTLPGIEKFAMRVDPTTLTMSVNGNPVQTTTAGSARTAATELCVNCYEGVSTYNVPIGLQSFSVYSGAVPNASLTQFSAVQNRPVPTFASTIATGSYIGFASGAQLPSGNLLALWDQGTGGLQGKPDTVQYSVSSLANAIAGVQWPAGQLAINNTDSSTYQGTPAVLVANGTIYLAGGKQHLSGGVITGTLWMASTTEASPGVPSFPVTPCTVNGSPFFPGTVSNRAGDFVGPTPLFYISSGPMAGYYADLLYGFQSGETSTSVGIIFSQTPANCSSWTGFTVIADGNLFATQASFSEASGFQVPAGEPNAGEIVVTMRDDGPAESETRAKLWRMTLSPGLSPTTRVNWNAPQILQGDASGEIRLPDTIYDPTNNQVFTSSGPGSGSNNEFGYAAAANNGYSYPQNNAAMGPNNIPQWYSQSLKLTDNFYGTFLGVGANTIEFVHTNPEYNPSSGQGIYFDQAPVASGDVLANLQSGTGVPMGVTPSALFGFDFGSTAGAIWKSGPSGWSASDQATFNRRTITSGATDTAGAYDRFIDWDSATASAKTETLPACATGIDGKKYDIADEYGSAGSYPITLAPASGTILGNASAAFNAPKGSVSLHCDGPNANWTVN